MKGGGRECEIPSLKKETSTCKCLPKFAKQWSDSGLQRKCVVCYNDLGGDRYKIDAVFPCLQTCRTDFHILHVLMHGGACAKQFCETVTEKDYTKYFSPLEAGVLTMSDSEQARYQDAYQKKHQLTGLACTTCGAAEQKHAKFSKCSACAVTVYCDEECQKQDWPKHKSVCGEVCLETLKPVYCSCLDRASRVVLSRQNARLCSNPKCTAKTTYTSLTNAYGEYCKHNKNVVHYISTSFCSTKCARKNPLFQ